jgi:bifunctional non-homologous end joining protein LigD
LQGFPQFTPAPLKKLPAAFDHDEFLFELKHDGFRALAYASPEACGLVSRRGIPYKSFRELRDSVLDGEIVSLDETGPPTFLRSYCGT